MDNKSNIGLVDPHPKSNSRNNYLSLIVHPLSLNIAFFLLTNIGMIKIHEISFSSQFLTHLLTLFSRNAIDNSRFFTKLIFLQNCYNLVQGVL